MNDKAMENRRTYTREYMREYRENNKEKLNEYQRDWRKANSEKVKQYNETYWTNKENGGNK